MKLNNILGVTVGLVLLGLSFVCAVGASHGWLEIGAWFVVLSVLSGIAGCAFFIAGLIPLAE